MEQYSFLPSMFCQIVCKTFYKGHSQFIPFQCLKRNLFRHRTCKMFCIHIRHAICLFPSIKQHSKFHILHSRFKKRFNLWCQIFKIKLIRLSCSHTLLIQLNKKHILVHPPHRLNIFSKHLQILFRTFFHPMETADCLLRKPVRDPKCIFRYPHIIDLHIDSKLIDSFCHLCRHHDGIFSCFQLFLRTDAKVNCRSSVIFTFPRWNLPSLLFFQAIINEKWRLSCCISRCFFLLLHKYHRSALIFPISGIVFHRHCNHFIPLCIKSITFEIHLDLIACRIQQKLNPLLSIFRHYHPNGLRQCL